MKITSPLNKQSELDNVSYDGLNGAIKSNTSKERRTLIVMNGV